MLLLLTLFSFLSQAIEFQDQFDQAHTLTSSQVNYIFYVHDMDGYKLFRDFLESHTKNPSEYLNEKKIAFVANISEMPKMVTKLFALPKMKKLNYPILLDQNGSKVKLWPKVEKGISVLKFDSNETVVLLQSLKTTKEIVNFFSL